MSQAGSDSDDSDDDETLIMSTEYEDNGSVADQLTIDPWPEVGACMVGSSCLDDAAFVCKAGHEGWQMLPAIIESTCALNSLRFCHV